MARSDQSAPSLGIDVRQSQGQGGRNGLLEFNLSVFLPARQPDYLLRLSPEDRAQLCSYCFLDHFLCLGGADLGLPADFLGLLGLLERPVYSALS